MSLHHEGFENVLNELVNALDGPGFALAPCMVFVDPFGFKLPIEKLARLLQQEKCDMIVNIMWRFVDLAIHNPKGQEQHLDALFGSDNWEDMSAIDDSHIRCDIAIQRIVKRLNAKHYCAMKMLAENGSIKYVLLHVANDQKAFDLIKDVVWALTPEGSLQVRQSDDPNQEFLIEPTADLSPLARIIWDQFDRKTVRLSAVYEIVDRTIFKKSHCHDLLREWRDAGLCIFSNYAGRFAFNKNPTIEFRVRPT